MAVNVSTDALRAAGKDLFEARKTLVEEADAHLLHGIDDDVNISTGGYYRGVACQQLLTDIYGMAQKTFADLLQNLTGLSAALYVVADVYEDTDLDEAFTFAFVEPGAPVPANLPDYIDKDVTGASLREQAEAQAAAAEGADLPEGWTTRTRYPYLEAGLGHEPSLPSYQVVELYDDEGNLVTTLHQYVYPDGRELTESYDGEGDLVSRQEVNPGGSTYATTYETGPDGKPRTQRTEHQVANDDGSTTYYTTEYKYDEDGDLVDEERVDEVTVGDQPDAVERGQGFLWEMEEQSRLQEEQAWREQDPDHDESEWRQTPKTIPG